MNHWIRPSCDSRTGASHLRRGAPCQDASGYLGCRDAAGTPIQVLVVSDGHGGSRYVRSDVGARLACEVALRELQQALGAARVADPGALEPWRRWLAEELPARIVAAWLEEVERHWRMDPGAEASAFSPLLYGATLGVLLLTPFWWAHTGLGDWDLVRIEAAGGEALLSEEPEREAAGEATFSLCLERAERHFAPRSALVPLTAEAPPFALLLCSDGLRKSCGSDADFLTLSRYLVGLSNAGDQAGCTELAEALDHISSQGSGDDISVAVARWVPAQQSAPWPEPGQPPAARLVQPEPGARSGMQQARAVTAACEPAAGARVEQPLAGSPSAAAPPLPRPSRRPGRLLVVAGALLAVGGVGLLIAAHQGLGPFAGRRGPLPLALNPQQRSDLQRQVAALCGPAAVPGGSQDRPGPAVDASRASSPGDGAARTGTTAATPAPALPASGVSAAPGAPSAPVPGPAAAAAPTVQRPHTAVAASRQPAVATGPALPSTTGEASEAHGQAISFPPSRDPQRQQRIDATLAARASVFQRLERGDPAQPAALLRQSRSDPLSALIALSATDANLRPPALPADPPDWLQRLGRRLAERLPFAAPPGRPAPAPASPLTQLGACPELIEALRAGWQRHGSHGIPARTTAIGRTPAAATDPARRPLPPAAGRPQPQERGGSSR